MATSSEIDVDTAVEEVLQTSLQDEDPLECLTNTQIAELYSRLTPEDQRLFLQFKAFHRQYYNQHGETMPSYQLARESFDKSSVGCQHVMQRRLPRPVRSS